MNQIRLAAWVGIVLGVLSHTGATAQSIDVSDQYRRAVTLEGPVERIVTIPIRAASILIAVDGDADRLAGIHHISRSAVVGGGRGEFFFETLDGPADFVGVGLAPTVEGFLWPDPELIIQWCGRGDDIVRLPTDAGLDVVALAYGTDEMTREWIEILGTVTCYHDKADRFLIWRDDLLSQVPDDIAGPDASACSALPTGATGLWPTGPWRIWVSPGLRTERSQAFRARAASPGNRRLRLADAGQRPLCRRPGR